MAGKGEREAHEPGGVKGREEEKRNWGRLEVSMRFGMPAGPTDGHHPFHHKGTGFTSS